MVRLNDKDLSFNRFKRYFELILSHHKRDKSSKCFRISIDNKRLYLCTRCSSIVMGIIIFALFHQLLLPHQMYFTWVWSLLISLILVIPMGLDGGLQYLDIIKSSKLKRVITGLLFGTGVVFISIYLSQILKISLFFVFSIFLFIMIYFQDSTKKLIRKINKR